MNNTQMTLVVNTTGGEIKANFDELKASLKQNLDKYRLVKYSDDAKDQMRQMKQDRAELNRLTDALKEKDKEVKKIIMIPYDNFHEGIVELLTLVEEPKQVIDTKVKELEEAAREAKRADIRAEYEKLAVNVDPDFKEELYKRLYEPKWENATTTKKAYKEGLKKGVDNFCYGMQCLKLSNHEFLDDGMREFKLTLDLNSAIKLMEQKASEKEELLRKEQERLEEERKRIEEEAKAKAEAEAQAKFEEERKRIEAESRAKAEAQAQAKFEEERKRIEAESRAKAEAQAQAKLEEERKQMEETVAKAQAEAKATATVDTFVSAPAPTPVAQPHPTQSNVYVPKTVTRQTNTAPTGSATNVVIVAFDASKWPVIQKYADRLGVTYTVK